MGRTRTSNPALPKGVPCHLGHHQLVRPVGVEPTVSTSQTWRPAPRLRPEMSSGRCTPTCTAGRRSGSGGSGPHRWISYSICCLPSLERPGMESNHVSPGRNGAPASGLRGMVRAAGVEPARPSRATGSLALRVCHSATLAWSLPPGSNRAADATRVGRSPEREAWSPGPPAPPGGPWGVGERVGAPYAQPAPLPGREQAAGVDGAFLVALPGRVAALAARAEGRVVGGVHVLAVGLEPTLTAV